MDFALYLVGMLLCGIVLGWFVSRPIIVNVSQNVVSADPSDLADSIELSPDDTVYDEDD